MLNLREIKVLEATPFGYAKPTTANAASKFFCPVAAFS